MKVTKHRKLANGGYVLEVDGLHSFSFARCPEDLEEKDYEKSQLQEVKALLAAEEDAGKKLASEGKKL